MNKKILLGMSGGVDSFASALLLKEQNFEVIGASFITWDKNTKGINIPPNKITPYESALKVAEICQNIGIKHKILFLSGEFDQIVIQQFISEYLSGQTPNICTYCNYHFKFKYLQKTAIELGCNYIATGHYAGIRENNGRYIISRAIDDWKDQSFMLWQLPQDILRMCVFPLENISKANIKRYVSENGFPGLAEQSESFSICFIPDNNYKNFLCRRINGLEIKLSNGELLDVDKNKLGTHDGYPFYTIGQCNNLNTNNSLKLYVKEIISHKNQIILAPKQDVFSNVICANQLNFVKYDSLEGEFYFLVRIRGKDFGTKARIIFHKNKEAVIYFSEPVFAPAKGQSVVFYEGNDLVGGGVIQ